MMSRSDEWDKYKDKWSRKKTGAIQKELAYWRRVKPQHECSYHLNAHDRNPDELSEGDRICILRDLLSERPE